MSPQKSGGRFFHVVQKIQEIYILSSLKSYNIISTLVHKPYLLCSIPLKPNLNGFIGKFCPPGKGGGGKSAFVLGGHLWSSNNKITCFHTFDDAHCWFFFFWSYNMPTKILKALIPKKYCLGSYIQHCGWKCLAVQVFKKKTISNMFVFHWYGLSNQVILYVESHFINPTVQNTWNLKKKKLGQFFFLSSYWVSTNYWTFPSGQFETLKCF